MKFYRFLWVAGPWKNLVFLSSYLIHWTLDLWCHICSSLLQSLFNSAFNLSTSWQFPFLIDSTSAFHNSSFVFFIWFFTLPKCCLLHFFNFFLHHFSLAIALCMGVPLAWRVHALEIVLLHFGLPVHIASNLKGLRFHFWLSPFGSSTSKIDLWFEVKQWRCLTLPAGNRFS